MESKTRNEVSYTVKERLEAVEKEKKYREFIFSLQTSLLVKDQSQKEVSLEKLLRSCSHLKTHEYEDVVTERSLEKVCGFPICANPLNLNPTKSKSKFKLNRKTNELVKREDFERFCSEKCRKKSAELSSKLPLPQDIVESKLLGGVQQAPVIEKQPLPQVPSSFPVPGSTSDASKIEGFESSFVDVKDNNSEREWAKYIAYNFPSSSVQSATATAYSKSKTTLKRRGILKISKPEAIPEDEKATQEGGNGDLPESTKSNSNERNNSVSKPLADDGVEISQGKAETQIQSSTSEDVSDSSMKSKVQPKTNIGAAKGVPECSSPFNSLSLFNLETAGADISSLEAEFTPFMRLLEALNQFLHSVLDDRYSAPALGDVELDTFTPRRQVLRSQLSRSLDLVLQRTEKLEFAFTKVHLTCLINDIADKFDVSRPVPSLSSGEWKLLMCLILHRVLLGPNIKNREIYIQELHGLALQEKTQGQFKEECLSEREYEILLEKIK